MTRPGRLWAGTPLRIRLVAGVLALVAVALLGAGLFASETLRGYLVQRQDDQLRSAAPEIAHGPGPAGQSSRPDPDGDNYQHLPSEFVSQQLGPTGRPIGAPNSHLVDGTQTLPDLPRLTIAQAVARHGKPFTIGADDQGYWRVLAVPAADGSGTLLVATSLDDVDRTVQHLELLELVIGLIALAVIGLVASLMVRVTLRPLREVEETAAAIAGGDLSQRVRARDEHTEMGRLGAAINTMLGRIEDSFRARSVSEAEARASEERMRRFVADASHELRTPLTSIRGFAELYRLKDQGDYVPEVTRGMRRIEQEATRMGLLVDDLLLLARLDRERPLRADPVDLLEVAATAVHDARVAADGRRIDLVVGRTDPQPVVIGDSDRLHQIVANLLNNALAHAPDDTAVEVRVSTAAADRAVLEVVDHGPGLAASDAERVFERFYRSDSARSRDDGGAGLGLAIVAALVKRHRGAVAVEETPGGGATFRVELPLA